MHPPPLSEIPKVAETLRHRRGGIAAEKLLGKIPRGIRLVGEPATLDYLRSHDLSHIRSVKNYPELKTNPRNVIFESRRSNRARGAADMTRRALAKARLSNAARGVATCARNAACTRVVAMSGATAITKGMGIGALVELPVSVAVETLHVVNGRKTVQDAVLDGAQTVGVGALFGGAAMGVLTAASTFGLVVGGPVLVPLAVIGGGGAYVWMSSERIWEALDSGTRTGAEARLATMQDAIGDHARAVRDYAGAAVGATQERFETAVAALIGG